MKKYYQSEAWLRHRYHTQRKTIQEIAKECDCSTATIQNYLEKYGLIRNPRKWK